MIKDKLRMLILKQLQQKPRSGYGLIKDIEEHTGWKPSYGSIYPALDHLKEEGLVTFTEEGRKKVYALTDKGKEAAKELKYHNKELLERFGEMNKLFGHLLGIKAAEADEMTSTFLGGLMKGDASIKEMIKASAGMKKESLRIFKEGLYKEHKKEVIAIFDEAEKKLQKIQKK